MPTYVYKFVETGETIEVQQSFTDPSLTEAVHPTSGRAMPVKKVFTPVGVTFKGGGFYKTDSRGGSKSSASSNTSAGGTDGTSAGSGDSTSSSGPSSSESSSTSAAATPAPAPAKTPAATS